jgi:hypothetical protein
MPARKKTEVNSSVSKGDSLFDHINNIRHIKKPWARLSDVDKKTWSTYMVNRFLSMNPEYTELVNELQKYTIGVLQPREVYKLYFDILPKDRSYSKYIKGKSEEKYNKELVNIIRKTYLYSIEESEEYLDMILELNPTEVNSLLKRYGKTDKEIKNLLKI